MSIREEKGTSDEHGMAKGNGNGRSLWNLQQGGKLGFPHNVEGVRRELGWNDAKRRGDGGSLCKRVGFRFQARGWGEKGASESIRLLRCRTQETGCQKPNGGEVRKEREKSEAWI